MSSLLKRVVSVTFQNKMTGFATEVSKGGLCLCSYPLFDDYYSSLFSMSLLVLTEVLKLTIKGTGEVIKCCLYDVKS